MDSDDLFEGGFNPNEILKSIRQKQGVSQPTSRDIDYIGRSNDKELH
jgi:hypothetical protein